MLKILLINNCHYRRGGADVVYLNTSYLLEKNGNVVIHFSQYSDFNLPSKESDLFVDEINFFKKSFFFKKFKSVIRFLYSFESKVKLLALLKRENPDIAHVHLYKGTLTPSILISLKKFGIPVILTLHDYGLLCPHNTFLDGKNIICTRCIKGSPLNCFLHRCNRNSYLHSAVSAFEYVFHREFVPFVKYFSRFIAVSKFGFHIHSLNPSYKEKLCHLYNFVPDNLINSDYIDRGEYFLYFGRFSNEKGILTLIKAWSLSEKKTKLKILGSGPLLEEMNQFLLKANVTSIEILSFQEGDKLYDTIRNASFVIVPSEWYENNPLSIIESYALGKPVIASDVGGIPEIIRGNTGLLFKMGDVLDLSNIIEYAESISDDQYAEFAKGAKFFASQNFSEDVHYSGLIEIYKGALSENENDISKVSRVII